MKKLLVLAAGRLQVPAIVNAKEMGLRVIVVDGCSDATGVALGDKAYIIDITDPVACLDVAEKENVDGVIHICSEVAMTSMGEINSKLGLHGLGPKEVVAATNKHEMRKAFKAGGAPSPISIEVTNDAEAILASNAIAGDIIVKPARNSGSRGITYLGINRKTDSLLEAFSRALSESRDPSVLIEEYVEGPEFSVEAIVFNSHIHILAITDKLTTGKPHFVELGHSQPTKLSLQDQILVRDAAALGIKALGINWCAAHAEIRLTSRGPVLMEIGARLGGDFITTELVPRSTGINMVKAAIQLSLGEEPTLNKDHPGSGVAIRYVTPKPGIVTRILGMADAQKSKGVKIVEVYKGVGDTVYPVDSSLARSGHVIAEGSTADEAIANAEAAVAKIIIETK